MRKIKHHKHAKKKRGQIVVISGVMLLLLGLFIIYFAFTFIAGTEVSVEGHAVSELGAKIIEMKTTFRLENQDGSIIFIKNTGSVDIEDGRILVYLDDKGVYADIDEVIKPGETNIMIIDGDDWSVVEGPAGTKAKLVVPGKLITESMTVVKPEVLE